MFNVGPGSVINLTNYTHYTPGMQMGFKPPKGMVSVFILLKNADKKNPDSFDAECAMRRLGWVPQNESNETIATLQHQREELLAALEQISQCGAAAQARHIAQAVIARAKGGAV